MTDERVRDNAEWSDRKFADRAPAASSDERDGARDALDRLFDQAFSDGIAAGKSGDESILAGSSAAYAQSALAALAASRPTDTVARYYINHAGTWQGMADALATPKPVDAGACDCARRHDPDQIDHEAGCAFCATPKPPVDEPWPGYTADQDRRRVETLAKLGLMLSVMAGGEAPEVTGFDAADLYGEVLMALAIEDAEDADIALQDARDDPEGHMLTSVSKPPVDEAMREALEEARLQLVYLDERFPTGTTPAVIARVDTAIRNLTGEGAGA